MNPPKFLKLILFATELHDEAVVLESRKAKLDALRQICPFSIIKIQDYDGKVREDEVVVSFIGTGGSEELFLQYRHKLPHPWTFLSDSFHNSLAATQEITSWIFQQQREAIHLHGFESLNIDRLTFVYRLQKAYTFIRTRRIGLLGDASPWLIASQVDLDAVEKKWGAKFVQVPLYKVKERFESIRSNVKEHVADIVRSILSGAQNRVEPTEEDVEKAMHLYLTLSEGCSKNKFNALTLRCFDVIHHCQMTACLALARLNDQGIIAGCEGDIPALWSMILIQAITGCTSFIANPSDILVEQHIIDLAHCTVPLKMCDSYTLRDHFESRSSVGIQGHFSPGRFTIFKCGGTQLDRYFVTEADYIEEPLFYNRCRTQMRLRTDRPVQELMEAHLGNHMIVVKGAYKKEIDSFMHIFGIKPC